MDASFLKEYDIHYYEIDKYREATPAAIMNFLEDTAIQHSESAGLGIDKLAREGICWVLNGWFVQFHMMPGLFDKITVQTWASGFERFYANREYIVRDMLGNTLVSASSLWILVNYEKKRPVRIPESYGDAYGINTACATGHKFPKIDIPSEYDIEKQFLIRKSDIDTNGHANNKRYIDWMLEAIPQAAYDDSKLSVLEISYLKGAYYGLEILSQCKGCNTENPAHEYIHVIKGCSGDTIHAAGKTLWLPKEAANDKADIVECQRS